MTWSLDRARKTYSIPHWSEGYFDVGDDGRVVVRPRGKAAGSCTNKHYRACHLFTTQQR